MCYSLLIWLADPGLVLIHQNIHDNKYKALVPEVQLLEANSQYAIVKFDDRHESAVSVYQIGIYNYQRTKNESTIIWEQKLGHFVY